MVDVDIEDIAYFVKKFEKTRDEKTLLRLSLLVDVILLRKKAQNKENKCL